MTTTRKPDLEELLRLAKAVQDARVLEKEAFRQHEAASEALQRASKAFYDALPLGTGSLTVEGFLSLMGERTEN